MPIQGIVETLEVQRAFDANANGIYRIVNGGGLPSVQGTQHFKKHEEGSDCAFIIRFQFTNAAAGIGSYFLIKLTGGVETILYRTNDFDPSAYFDEHINWNVPLTSLWRQSNNNDNTSTPAVSIKDIDVTGDDYIDDAEDNNGIDVNDTRGGDPEIVIVAAPENPPNAAAQAAGVRRVRSLILRLPTSDMLEQALQDENCSFCLDLLRCENELVTLSCRHTFHSRCYFRWLPNLTCPNCRRDTTTTMEE